MQQIKIKINNTQDYSYPIFIESDFFKEIIKFLHKKFPESTCVIVTDKTVEKLYGKKLRALIKKSGRKVFLFSIPPGEKSKNQKNKTIIEEKMLKEHIDRQSIIIALGGGVVGDLAGFIAATYMRGISYIQVPTTLLAMVDSSIGGKTGIDTPQGKNLVGSFWQPEVVFIDFRYLETLPQKQFINGLIEAIKMFITSDANSFLYVEKNIDKLLCREQKILKNVVKNTVAIKARIVERDERDEGKGRMILNFGHTIGHVLEKLSQYKMLHAYAVALGIIVEARLAVNIGNLGELDYLRIKKLLINKLGINLKYLRAYKPEEIIYNIKSDKKNKNGKPHYVILKGIGEVNTQKNIFAHPIENARVVHVLKKIRLENKI